MSLTVKIPSDDLNNCFSNRDSFSEYSWDDVDVIHYREIKLLGQGTFGKVSLVVDGEGNQFAMKTCLEEHYLCDTKQEAEMLMELQHENIVKLHNIIKDGNGFKLVMELYHGTALDLLIDNGYSGLEEEVIRDLTIDVLRALSFMRSKHYSHCDLKPENILYKIDRTRKSGYRFVISDFGNVVKGDKLPYFYRIQTNHYRCAENLLNCTDITSCDYPSLACIIYELFTGEYLVKSDQYDPEVEKNQILQQMKAITIKTTNSMIIKVATDEKKTEDRFIMRTIFEMRRSNLHTGNGMLDKNIPIGWIDLIERLLLPFPKFRLQGEEALRHYILEEEEEYELVDLDRELI